MTENAQTQAQNGSIDRRTFLRTTGAVAGAVAVGTGVTGSAAARRIEPGDDVDSLGIPLSGSVVVGTPSIFNPQKIFATKTATARFLANGAGSVLSGSSNGVDTVGNVAFHQTAVSSYSNWQNATTLLDNWINDATMVANISARDAIARSWEDGLSESEAQQNAHDAIYDHFSIAYRNTIVSGLLNALELAFIADTSENASDVQDWDFWGVADADYTGSGSLVDADTGIKTQTVEADFTLPNGETQSIETIQFEAGWDNGDSWEQTVNQTFIDNYDKNSSEWTFTTTDGNFFTDDFTASTLSVPSADLPSRRCLSLKEWMDTLNKIQTKADNLTNNYPTSFIGNLYTALDNGTIDPVEVRGVEGTAEFLSGSSDATEGRYQIALSSVLDGVRPDLSTTSEMQVEITGYTDALFYADGTQRLEDFVEEKPEVGMLFARSMPEQGIEAGKSYTSNLPIVSGSGDNTVKLLDASDGTELWSISGYGSDVLSVAPMPSGDQIVSGSGDNTVKLLDASDGTELWSNGHGDDVTSVAPMPSGDQIVSASNDKTVRLLDASDGTELWSNGHGSDVRSVAPMPSGDQIVSGSGDNTVRLLDASDGTELWSFSGHGDDVRSVAPFITQRSQAYEQTAGRLSGEFHAIQPPDETDAPGEEIDVQRVRGKIKITGITDSDGSEVTDPVSWERPKYDSFDTTEYSDYLDKVTKEYSDALNEAGDPATGGIGGIGDIGDGFLDGLPSLPGFSTLQSIAIVGLGAWVFGQLSN